MVSALGVSKTPHVLEGENANVAKNPSAVQPGVCRAATIERHRPRLLLAPPNERAALSQ
jgi:hypothetical protein